MPEQPETPEQFLGLNLATRRDVRELLQALLNAIKKSERKIMSAITDFVARQKEFNTQQSGHIEEVATAVDGVAADVAELKRLITELQNNPGPITPEDQALLDELDALAAATTSRLKAASTALKALDEATPPVAPPVS